MLKKLKSFLSKIKDKSYNFIYKIIISIEKHLPLKKNIVFECESDMDDNPRAVYEYLLEKGYNKKHKLVWIVKNVDLCRQKYVRKNVVFISRFDKSYKNQIKLNYYLSTSKWFIFSHPYWFKKKRKKQIVVHINHGSGLKGLDQKSKFNSEIIDYLVVPSEQVADKEMLFWNCPDNKLIFCGFPRIDFLYKGDKLKIFNSLFKWEINEKVIICMPTYKQSSRVIDSDINDRFSFDCIKDELDFFKVNEFLAKHKIHLIIKLHPLQRKDLLYLQSSSFIHYLTNEDLFSKNIILYELIGKCDALITDLSSVYTDYLVLNRPVAFLIENIKNYKRGYIDNPYKYMPGDRIKNKEDFFNFCIKINQNNHEFELERLRVFNYFHSKNHKDNSKVFCDWLFNKSELSNR